jgi:Ca2+-binding RTX toxin-like protein
MTIWTGPQSFEDRVNTLRLGLLTPNQDVWGDGDADTLTGKSGDDWFFIDTDLDPSHADVIVDLKKDDDLTFVPIE